MIIVILLKAGFVNSVAEVGTGYDVITLLLDYRSRSWKCIMRPQYK